MTKTHASPKLESPEINRVAIVGAAGQLGTALIASAPPGVEVIPITRREVDISDAQAVASSPLLHDVDCIINAAAFTDVDGAEAKREAAAAVNADGARWVAQRAAAEGAFLIHVSTDYVFGDAHAGRASEAGARPGWRPDDATAPATVYGQTKLAGEKLVRNSGAEAAVVRTAWVWSGPTQPEARDFVSTMLRLAADPQTYPEVKVVDDQFGNPTFVGDLAAALWELVSHPTADTFHVVGTSPTTWYEFARAIFAAVGAEPTRVVPCTSEEFPRPAPRPHWSVLDTTSWQDAGFTPLPEWQATLTRILT